MTAPYFSRNITCGDTDINNSLIKCGSEYDLEKLDPAASGKALLKCADCETLTFTDRSYSNEDVKYQSDNRLIEMHDGTMYAYRLGEIRREYRLDFRLIGSTLAIGLYRFYSKLQGSLLPFRFTDIGGTTVNVRWMSSLSFRRIVNYRYDTQILLAENL